MTDIVERLENWGTVYEEDDDCDGALYLAARDEILRLREGWRDIESAPRDVRITWKRVFEGEMVAFGVAEWRNTHWHWPDGHLLYGFAMPRPTHWRPPPDPPQK